MMVSGNARVVAVIGVGVVAAAMVAVAHCSWSPPGLPAALGSSESVAPETSKILPVATTVKHVVSEDRLSLPDLAAAARDLIVELEAPLLQRRHVPLVVTETDASNATVVRHETRSDLSGTCRMPAAWCEALDPRSVVCVDLGFPSGGAHAMQIDASTETAVMYSPPRGLLEVEVREADGQLVAALATATVRVVAATPPSDRGHALGIRHGTGSIMLEAARLQVEVVVTLRDGRKVGPVSVTGPASEGERVTCAVQLPARPMLHFRLRDVAGRLLPANAVELRLASLPESLVASAATAADGVVRLPCPAVDAGAHELSSLIVSAKDKDGIALHGTLLARLGSDSAGSLGDVTMVPSSPLVAGVCTDESGKAIAGLRLLLFRERAAGERAKPFADPRWQLLSLPDIVTDSEGKFRVLGPPQGGRLQLRVVGGAAGRAAVRTECVPGDLQIAVVVPELSRRRGLLW